MQVHSIKNLLIGAIFLTVMASCNSNERSNNQEDMEGPMDMMEQDALEDDLREEMHNPNHYDHDSAHHEGHMMNGDHMMDSDHMMDGDHMHDQVDPG